MVQYCDTINEKIMKYVLKADEVCDPTVYVYVVNQSRKYFVGDKPLMVYYM